ncbi:coiled-coil domain-containing protein 89 [Aplysia californica]|uniref:Coiled-coil domain-containing protein 89 n=1 Tax=Aplysia californica TaxID=6500 RepID=A0ABM0JCF2_APLCA|nr:coiled-coil domain-containing protein 89 [Aplysia californica]
MSSQSSRSPKELRQMVYDSSKDMDEMQENLSKLRALSEDDKTENAKLRSRIDEQCQLIMILKKKADEGTMKIQTLERINKELLDFRDQADSMLKTEIKKYNILDGRFNNLASNHEEMIRIKDDYKRVNQDLREENARLKDENGKLFSKTVIEKDHQIQELDKKCAGLHEQCSALEQKLRQQQVEWRGKEDALRKQISEMHSSNTQQARDLLKRLQDTEEKLKGTEHKLQVQLESKQKLEGESSEKFQQLQKEKAELLSLVMQRGKLVQKEQENNKDLQKKIAEMEKAVHNMENKFEREADAVNSNLRVRKLTDALEDSDSKYSQMVKEFEAFKKHSNDLLKKEKDLNERLRHLYS